MSIQIIPKARQGYGTFNSGEIVENKPIGFPQDGGEGKPFSNLFYWAYAEAKTDSTIGLHPHQGFEIMSFVLKGNIRHYDTQLKKWQPLSAGDVQIIRSGNGISHAEHMEAGSAMFQIWVDPNLNQTLQQTASYNDYKAGSFPVTTSGDLSIKTFRGDQAPLKMDAIGMEIKELSFDKAADVLDIHADRIYSLYLLEGSVRINQQPTEKDDFAIVKDSTQLVVESEEPGRIFMISTLASLPYKTYVEHMAEKMQQR